MRVTLPGKEKIQNPVRIAVAGACGKMGKEIIKAAATYKYIRVVGALERPGHVQLGKDIFEICGLGDAGGVHLVDEPSEAFQDSEVIIDFTSPEATIVHAEAARKLRVSMVIGTTG